MLGVIRAMQTKYILIAAAVVAAFVFMSWLRSRTVSPPPSDLPQQVSITKLVLEKYPEFVPAYNQLGKAYESRKMYQDALHVYQLWAKQFPDDAVSYFSMARVYELTGQNLQFKQALQKAVRLEPSLGKDPQIAKLLSD